jgi:hypothetical protein
VIITPAAFRYLAAVSVIATGAPARPLLAQAVHPHTPIVSGVPAGVPLICAVPTIVSVGSGAWSSPATWSTGRVPGADDKVLIAAGHDIAYDAASDAALSCIEVRGRLAFKTDVNTRMKVVTLMVMEGGALEVGTPARPVAPRVTAEIVVADTRLDTTIDPGQFGNGMIALGRVTMHGAVKAPTFVRLTDEPLAGQTRLAFAEPVSGGRSAIVLCCPTRGSFAPVSAATTTSRKTRRRRLRRFPAPR